MRWLAALLLALLSIKAMAATAYVSDELVLGVYAEENNQGQRLATLHSGTSVETLAQNGDFTQIRMSDGTTGWVKSAFLTAKEPAVVRVKRLEEELDQARASMAGDRGHRSRHRIGRGLLARLCHAGAARTRQIRGDQSLLNPEISGPAVDLIL